MSKMIKSAGIILLRRDGSVLAQLRDKNPAIANPDTWAICGGGMEPEIDISIQHAGARELFEETGYIVDPNNLQFLYRECMPGRDGVTIENTYFWALYDEKQTIGCFEGQEIRFLSPRECQAVPFVAGHRELLLTVSGYLSPRHPERRG